jgi:electron transfer flavoprotein beta subunit
MDESLAMSLNIIVCIKTVALQAPDSRGRIPVEAYDLNPLDRPALEAVLQLKEQYGGSVTALSMGPEFAVMALRQALALGVDRAVLLSDAGLVGSDTLATSTALAAALRRLMPLDLVVFGARTADGDTGHVGPQTAVALDLAMVTGACEMELSGGALKVVRRADGLVETFQMNLPGCLSIHPAAMQLRETALFGIEESFTEGEVEKWSMDSVGIAADDVGEPGSPTRVLATHRVVRKQQCEFIEGAEAEQAEQLVNRLMADGLLG